MKNSVASSWARTNMVASIVIEGVRVRGRAIPRGKLVSIWEELTVQPFPKVMAFQIEDRDFDRLVMLRKCSEDERREILEWGRVLSAQGTDACVFNADESLSVDYLILMREKPYHDFDQVLMHELSHIADGDLD
jgi:hypothetical protein